MALMSMLFLCLFAPPLAQAYENGHEDSNNQKNSSLADKALSLYFSGVINEAKELRPLFTDDLCQQCFACVEQAFDMLNNYSHQFESTYSDKIKLQNATKRIKRNAANYEIDYKRNTEQAEDGENKSVTVTKYKNTEGRVYAIKVNEINNEASESNDEKSTCKVYSVKKSSSCQSEESNLILMKRKAHKKRVSKPNKTSTESRGTSAVKKHKVRIEKSRTSGSFIPPLEDIY